MARPLPLCSSSPQSICLTELSYCITNAYLLDWFLSLSWAPESQKLGLILLDNSIPTKGPDSKYVYKMMKSKLHAVHDIFSSRPQLYKTKMMLCAGTVLNYTAEYTKAKEMGFFLSGDLSACSVCQERKHVSNLFPTHFILLFSEIFLTNVQAANTYTFSKT